MNWAVAELVEQFQQLKRSSSALSEQMRFTAVSLVDPGHGPKSELESSIASYGVMWGEFCSELGLASHDITAENEPTWTQLQGRLTHFRHAKEALEDLRKVEQLRIPDGSESLLDPVRNAWHEVASRLSKSPWQETDLIQEVRAGHHPLCRLVSLVESLRGLTDEQWVAEMNAMQQMFGVAISTAIARGKLTLSADSR